MSLLFKYVQQFLSFGAVLILPLFILIIGLVFRMNFWKALKSGIYVGIGLQGVTLATNFLIETVQPVINAFSEVGSGFDFPIIDVGWAAISAAAWSQPFSAVILILALALNFCLLKMKFTKTLNVDIWNYWHFIFSASITYYMLLNGTNSHKIAVAGAIIVGLVCSVIACKIGDVIADKWQGEFGVKGTTCTTLYFTATFIPINWIVNKIMDHIPGVDKFDIDTKTVREKLGPIGEPSIFAFIVGIFMAAIARQGVGDMLKVGMGVSASIILLPKMVEALTEGITPLSEAAQDVLKKKLGEDQKFYLGMDIMLRVGDPTAITASLLLIPITVGIALIFPGNGFFPTATLGSLIYITALGAMDSEGKLLRTMIMGICFVIWHLTVLNLLADLCTMVMNSSGVLELAAGTKTASFGLDNVVNLIIGLIGKALKFY